MVSTKVAGGDVAEKTKSALDDIKNTFLNQPEIVNGKDEKKIRGYSKFRQNVFDSTKSQISFSFVKLNLFLVMKMK